MTPEWSTRLPAMASMTPSFHNRLSWSYMGIFEGLEGLEDVKHGSFYASSLRADQGSDRASSAWWSIWLRDDSRVSCSCQSYQQSRQ